MTTRGIESLQTKALKAYESDSLLTMSGASSTSSETLAVGALAVPLVTISTLNTSTVRNCQVAACRHNMISGASQTVTAGL